MAFTLKRSVLDPYIRKLIKFQYTLIAILIILAVMLVLILTLNGQRLAAVPSVHAAIADETGIAPDTTFILSLPQEIEIPELRNLIKLEPMQNFEIAGTDEPCIYELKPVGLLEKNSEVSIFIGEKEFPFIVRDELVVTGVSPSDNAKDVPLATALIITLNSNKPLNRNMQNKAFSITHVASGESISHRIRQYGPDVYLCPSVPMKENAQYIVTISPPLENTNGARFMRSYTFSFTTGFEVSEKQSAPDEPETEFLEIKNELIKTLEEQLLSEGTRAVLTESGISVSAEDIAMIGDRRFSFNLVLTDDRENRKEFQMTGYCAYFKHSGETFNSFNIEWGGVCVVSPSMLAVCSRFKIDFLNIADLSEADFSLDLEALGSPVQPIGIRYDSSLGYIVLINTSDVNPYIAFFDDSGMFTRKEELIASENLDLRNNCFTYGMINGFNPVSMFCADIMVLDTQPAIIVFPINFDNNSNGPFSVIYDISSQKTICITNLLSTSDRGRSAVAFSDIDSKYGAEHLAIYRDGDTNEKYFFFNGDIHPYFGYAYFRNHSPVNIQWEISRPVVSAASDFLGLTITLDFDNKSANIDYTIRPEDLSDESYGEIFALSPNGRYGLRHVYYDIDDYSGGDIWHANTVLQDTENSALYFLAVTGGMYGGYWRKGFFENGDVYILGLDRLKVFSIGENGPVPQRPLLTPLGKMEDKGFWRHLLAVVRSPANGTYIVLYAEQPFENTEIYYEGPPFRDNCNYLIGFCDEDGNIVQSYDTGEPVLFDFHGLCRIDLSLSGNDLTIATSTYNHRLDVLEIITIGAFNIETRTYSSMQ